MSDKNTIFVQIASYRDPELVPTLNDLLEKAKNPENLTICICWQHGDEQNLDRFKEDPRFIIIDVPWEASQGACWARHEIQQYYTDQKYTLQIDSHHRFVENWDEILIKMLEDLKKEGVKKPLLTAYLPNYNPKNDPEDRSNVPWQMNFKEFTSEGVILFIPGTIEESNLSLNKPLPARFYSAHFCFTDGIFSKEIQHDPDYYFHGEEISITVRAFTHGYDLFHPHKVVMWHEYTREGRTKHWDEHSEWWKSDQKCKNKNKLLFEDTSVSFGKFGFGNARTLKDYEAYAGVNFKKQAVQKYTADHNLPPNPVYSSDEDYEKSFTKYFDYTIRIQKNLIENKDYDFWAVIFEDQTNNCLYRQDLYKDEIDDLFAKSSTSSHYTIRRSFQTERQPIRWIVWPHTSNGQWGNKIENMM